jgi:hypothetical protein
MSTKQRLPYPQGIDCGPPDRHMDLAGPDSRRDACCSPYSADRRGRGGGGRHGSGSARRHGLIQSESTPFVVARSITLEVFPPNVRCLVNIVNGAGVSPIIGWAAFHDPAQMRCQAVVLFEAGRLRIKSRRCPRRSEGPLLTIRASSCQSADGLIAVIQGLATE